MKILNKKLVEEASKAYIIKEHAEGSIHAVHDFEAGVSWAEEQMDDLAIDFALYYVKNRTQYIANEQETARRMLFKQFLKERDEES